MGEEDGGGGNNARTDGSLSLEGEGWGEGEHTAQVTLCSLLQNTVDPSTRSVSCGGFSLLFFLFLLLVDLQIDDAANLIVVHRQQVVLAHLGDDLR